MNSGIVAFAFGSPARILSNGRIGRITSFIARQNGWPVFTQKDVPIDRDIAQVSYGVGKNNQPPTTLQMADQALQWVRENQIFNLLLVAAKPHLPRCRRDLELVSRREMRIIIIRDCKEIQEYPNNDWFCCESRQLWTRWKTIWLIREMLLRKAPLFVYRGATK